MHHPFLGSCVLIPDFPAGIIVIITFSHTIYFLFIPDPKFKWAIKFNSIQYHYIFFGKMVKKRNFEKNCKKKCQIIFFIVKNYYITSGLIKNRSLSQTPHQKAPPKSQKQWNEYSIWIQKLKFHIFINDKKPSSNLHLINRFKLKNIKKFPFSRKIVRCACRCLLFLEVIA